MRRLSGYYSSVLLGFIFFTLGLIFGGCSSEQSKHDQFPNDWFFQQRAYPNRDIPVKLVKSSIEQHRIFSERKNLINGYDQPWQAVGPNNIGGRITDLEMLSDDQSVIFAGSASGGIFKSSNLGNTWRSVFDDAMNLSIGDLAIAPSDENIIYAGTGEANAGGGSLAYDGLGMYRSDDQGESWSPIGLDNVGSIGRVQVSPADADVVYVAAMGRLFGNNDERGVFRTRNAGLTWESVLTVSDSTGAIDLAIHPTNENIIYAAMWERVRRPEYRQYGGATSGVYRSTDGGDTWVELSNGLPSQAADKGRIGLAIAPSNPDVVYAFYSDKIGYIEGLFRSEDGGDTWVRQAADGIEDLSYHWWFSKVFVDPNDENRVWYSGFENYESTDGGNSFSLRFEGVHVDQHATVIHPENSDLVVIGNDGGIFVSQDGGRDYYKSPDLPNIQFYTCEIDEQNPERLYGGAQDNGTLSSNSAEQNEWSSIFGGDGFRVIIAPDDNRFIIAEFQRGGIARSVNGGATWFDGRNGLFGTFNWNTPIAMDPNDPTVMYTGAQRIFKTTNRAQQWTSASFDLVSQQPGNLGFGTITAIDVSPRDSDIIYAGTDDGQIWNTTDGGETWTWRSADLPNRWVTSLECDPFDEHTIYTSFSGYRFDEFDGQVFRSIDAGQTWENLSTTLPNMPINKILADPVNKNVLYIATDLGVYLSDTAGADWSALGTDLPNVPVLDLDFHAGENFLLAASYGRSMYKYGLPDASAADDVAYANAIQLYPNPTADKISIETKNEIIESVRIFDQNGQLSVLVKNLNDINLGELPDGVYYVEIKTSFNKYLKKTIKISQ